jgi:carbon starvation protein
LWILIGCILVGGVHDFTALVASIRHKARSIAEVVRVYMSPLSYFLFLAFIWIALVYIIVAFTDIVAGSFVGTQTLENGMSFSGGGIASSSLLYLMLPLIMGLLLRYKKLSLGWATVIFMPLVGVSIWVGQHIPLDLAALLHVSDSQAHRIWDVLLLAYCLAASLIPMWLLLQPRGHLGGYFLFAALIGGMLGILFSGESVKYPAWVSAAAGRREPMIPILFITIACGACSGFHALVATGTTSKQLRCEPDAKSVGYGAMLLEGMVAVVSLCCVMMLRPETAAGLQGKPNFIYAQGIGRFLGVLGVPATFGIAFALLAFTTFVYDTLDVSTRLGRYVLEELTGLRGRLGRVTATAITVGAPLLFVMRQTTDSAGRAVPAWRAFWGLFGASNQLLAALTLIGVTVWLWRTYRARWVWVVTGIPAVFMYIMSSWTLLRFVRSGFFTDGWEFKAGLDPIPWVAMVLAVLGLLVLIEAARAFLGPAPPPLRRQPEPVPAGNA